MIADVVGYSRMVEADEATTLAAVRTLRTRIIEPLTAEQKGRIVKLTGDGVLAEFGSVVEAVTCAVAIQRRIAAEQADAPPNRRILFRIGINLGDVVVEPDDIYGDAVNVAARLEPLAEPGGILISGTAFDHMQGTLGLPLDDMGEQHLKNIARPVRAYAVRLDGSERPVRQRRTRWTWLAPAAVAAAIVALGAGGAAFYWWPSASPLQTVKPSIAVIPFQNLGGDAATGRLADGLTDDVITDLARYRDFDIIARNSVDTYRDKATDVRQIGKDLNVRYVLEGSIQRDRDRIRVNAQLIDTTTAAHIWSERWDRPAEDVFAVQSEVSEHTASAVAGSDLLLADMQAAALRKRPGDLQAYDLTVMAYESFLKGTEADTRQGIAQADRAIARDPDFARAYVQKAWLIQDLAKYEKNWNAASAEMERLARTAIRLDPYDANGHILLAWTLATLDKNDEAMVETERALELNPSSADVLNMAADTMSFLGKPEDGAAMCDRSFRLNPTPPDWYYADCVTDFYFVGRYQEAVTAVERGAASTEPDPPMLVLKAASEAELGRTRAATATLAALNSLYPDVSFEWLLNTGWNFSRPEDQKRILESSRKAGLRICASADELTNVAAPKRLPECGGGTAE